MTSWNHAKCFNLPKAMQKEGATAESFVAEDLDDPDGIFDEHKDEIIEAIEAKGVSAPKNKKASAADDDNTMLGAIKRNYETVQASAAAADDGEDRPAKKIKLSNDEHKEVVLYETFSKMNAEELKDFLRWNRQGVTGVKAVLILRCIDGDMRGRLARCPLCKRGQPKLAEAAHDFASCNGYYDDEMGGRVSCSYKVPVAKAARILPWLESTPTEEQEAEMDELAELAKSGKTAPNPSNEAAVKDILKKAKNDIDWKVGNKSEIKATATAMVTIAKNGGVNLPEGGELKAVGKILVANAKTSTAAEVMQLVLDEYGFASDQAAAAEATADAAHNVCACSANAKYYGMLDEFGSLMRKSGEYMKANSYKKSADAVAALEFEITVDNALKLGKSGKLKTPGIGKSTAEKLQELAETGTVVKLEEAKASIE